MPNFIINVKEKGAKKAEKNVKGLTKSLGGLKSQAMMAAGAFLGGGALIAGIKGAVDAFGEQELAEKKLEASLGRTSQALLDQAAALQQVSNFGDETIISAQALIAAFVDDEEQIKKATQATLDLAAAKGMDLNAAADLVSKTLGSSTNAMSRYGIEVEGAVGSTERLDSLTGNIADKFGGQAFAQSETLTGSIKGMQDAAGDTAEAIGELLAPAIDKISTAFKGAAENATSFIKSLTDEDEVAKENTLTNERNGAVMSILTSGYSLATSALDRLGISGGLRAEIQEQETQQIEAYNNSTKGQIEALDKIEQFEIRRGTTAVDFGEKIKKVAVVNKTIYDEEAKRKEQALKDDLKNAALSGQSASDSMKAVVRAKLMESIASAMASVFKNPAIPYPLNMLAAAGVGGALSAAVDKNMAMIPSFATGGDFVTSGEELIRVGDNASGRERVQITPLDAGGEPTGSSGSVVINVSGNVMSQDYVEGELASQLKDAIRRGADIGVS